MASRVVPAGLTLVGVAVLALWLGFRPHASIASREPGQDGFNGESIVKAKVDLKGTFTKGDGTPADWPGDWPSFRGPKLDGISTEQVPLARTFKSGGPSKLWSLEVGEGYAGAAIHKGAVYLLDYDQKGMADVLRCLSLADGKEIWRHSYIVDITRNHGITRTVPAVTDKYVVALGPKCHVICLDSTTGEYKWGIDLVDQYKTTVPQWYAGQCPLIDGERAILAPAGDSLLIAVNCADGQVVWKTPNPRKWQMTHSSVAPMTFNGRKMYIYAATGGVVGVSAEDGQILWETAEWKVKMANVPTPVPLADGRVFLSGGYGAGCMMVQLVETGGKIECQTAFKLGPEVFGAEQHTPILYDGHIYGLIPPTGELVCLNLEGKRLWRSGGKYKFGLGPFMIADGMIIALSEKGVLHLIEATPQAFKPLVQAEVIKDADEAWGPMALAGGRLIVRDMTRLVCVDLKR